MRLIKNILLWLKELLMSPVLQTKLEKRYPTCRFYWGSRVDETSTLGKYNVIFKNTVVINSKIGDHSFIQKNSTVINADIGKFCSIAAGVCIGLGQHPINQVSTHPAFYSNTQPIAKTFSKSDTFNPFERITIGHDVWIGQNALIMDGVRIGTGAIVAAGAIVTKDVPEYAVVAGIPARIIKYRFTEQIIRKLKDIRWWEESDNWLIENCALFPNPEEFIRKLSGDR